MTEKRFTIADGFKIVAIRDNGKIMNSIQVCNKLNELVEEKEMWRRECERLKGLYHLENEKDEHLAWKRVDVE